MTYFSFRYADMVVRAQTGCPNVAVEKGGVKTAPPRGFEKHTVLFEVVVAKQTNVVNLSLQSQSSGQCAPETGVERSDARKRTSRFLTKTTPGTRCTSIPKQPPQ
jgi:hypothetical protein